MLNSTYCKFISSFFTVPLIDDLCHMHNNKYEQQFGWSSLSLITSISEISYSGFSEISVFYVILMLCITSFQMFFLIKLKLSQMKL